MLTSGKATGAYTSGNRNVDTGFGNGYDRLQLEPGFNGVRIEFVLATQEAPSTLANMDVISILDVTIGAPIQYAFDTHGNQINALSPFLLIPDAIVPPDSLTGYTRSSPRLVRTIISTSGPVGVVISVCDVEDALNDSGFLLRAEGCIDCDFGSDKFEINYVYATTTPPLESSLTLPLFLRQGLNLVLLSFSWSYWGYHYNWGSD
ncbi:hypothetical protein FDENT_8437 [Fusarium denticulatum]|uniref:Uncharacterized protein n=1 Tax=Fusarium denticulatum TaxID=48507 RepID=A0A8H5U3U4_9HYPO|nr:hypothetical protein FDENT_8437 [Fusarium denticulatum]